MSDRYSLYTVPVGAIETNCYIWIDHVRGEALVVDPGDDASKIIDTVSSHGGTPVLVLLTHGHYDHVLALPTLVQTYAGIEVVCCALEEPFMRCGMSAYPPESAQAASCVTRWVADGDTISFGDATFTVLGTPGHTAGSVCFYQKEEGILFSGDTLFLESCGRVDLPGGNARQMRESLGRLKHTLPDETKVYPGHMEETTMAHEKESNIYMQKS